MKYGALNVQHMGFSEGVRLLYFGFLKSLNFIVRRWLSEAKYLEDLPLGLCLYGTNRFIGSFE